MNFTWDKNKAVKVKDEHKIDFDKIRDVFNDPFAVEFIDEEHSTGEEIRFEIIGLTFEYGLIHLVFIEITENTSAFYNGKKG